MASKVVGGVTGGEAGVLQVTIAEIYAPEDVVSELGPLYRPRRGPYLVSLFSFAPRAGHQFWVISTLMVTFYVIASLCFTGDEGNSIFLGMGEADSHSFQP